MAPSWILFRFQVLLHGVEYLLFQYRRNALLVDIPGVPIYANVVVVDKHTVKAILIPKALLLGLDSPGIKVIGYIDIGLPF